jgi:hypothetical protein
MVQLRSNGADWCNLIDVASKINIMRFYKCIYISFRI